MSAPRSINDDALIMGIAHAIEQLGPEGLEECLRAVEREIAVRKGRFGMLLRQSDVSGIDAESSGSRQDS